MKSKKNLIYVVTGFAIMIALIGVLSYTGVVGINKTTDMNYYNERVLPDIEHIEKVYNDSWNDNYQYTIDNVSNMSKSDIIQRMADINKDYGDISKGLSQLDDSKLDKVDKEHMSQYVINMRHSIISRLELTGMITEIVNGGEVNYGEAEKYSAEAFERYIGATIHISQITNNK